MAVDAPVASKWRGIRFVRTRFLRAETAFLLRRSWRNDNDERVLFSQSCKEAKLSGNFRRVPVMGGSGFVGSQLRERPLRQGRDVQSVDNFFCSTRHNVEHVLTDNRIELVRHDVTFPLYVEVDKIYNLACSASPMHHHLDPVQTTKTCVIGAINTLGLAKRLKVKFLQASKSKVYGDPLVHPQTEEYWGHVNPIGPRSCYHEGKR